MKKIELFIIYGEEVNRYRKEIMNWGCWFSRELGNYVAFEISDPFRYLCKELKINIRSLTKEEKKVYEQATKPKKRKKSNDERPATQITA